MRQSPNLMYILADDMGYGDLSCLNAESKIRTTHLDRLAAEGMAFTDAHASSAVCTPSRYSILTGRYNWRSALKSGVLDGYDGPLLEPGRLTVASMLKQHGYATGCVGKWHLGWTWPRSGDDPPAVDFSRPISDGPTDAGFDRYFGIAASLDMPPYVYIDNDTPTAVPDREIEANKDPKRMWRPGPIAPDFEHEQVLPRLTEEAERFIDEHAQEPFFLYFPLPAPHTPILPTPEFRGKSGTNAYGDFCLQVDDVVGRIMQRLEQHGIADNTILVFTSDNGCSPQADFDELAACGHHPSYVFRGHKADIYEGGHRVPLIVRWPSNITPGSACNDTVCLVDLMATMADIVGHRLPDDAGEDSVSKLSLWNGDALDGPLREATVSHSVDGSFAIRQGRWKLELCPGSGGWSYPRPGRDCQDLPAFQLYDLDADVGERKNVVHERPEIVDQLRSLLTAYIQQGRCTPGKPQNNAGGVLWEGIEWMTEHMDSPASTPRSQ